MRSNASSEDARLIQLLNEHHRWPCVYDFKFIVPAAQVAELRSLFPEAVAVEVRPSKAGKYQGLTFRCPMGSGREVLTAYARVRGIPGLIAL